MAMTFQQYIQALPEEVSTVKEQILKILWKNEWVPSKNIQSQMDQKNYDRRLRELRNQLGCDIQEDYRNSAHCYRLRSTELGPYHPRKYLNRKQKKVLFDTFNYTCNICGNTVDPLQADHRVPLSRGGDHDDENWQPLCTECNLAKKSACRECELDCHDCIFAFPENTGKRLVINISSKLYDQVTDGQTSDHETVEILTREALRQYLYTKPRTGLKKLLQKLGGQK